MFKSVLKTIKLNGGYWNKQVFLKLVKSDPLEVFSKDVARFSEAMTSFKFSGVYKSTRAGRHQQTHDYLKQYITTLNKLPVIIDIGASDGTTSLELIELLNNQFYKYYVTDYNIKCSYIVDRGFVYFFNQSAECFLIASKKFVFYPESKFLFNLLFREKLNKVSSLPKKELLLCNHNLKFIAEQNKEIEIGAYNIFEMWKKEKADIVIIGNLLNPVYFNKEDIYRGLFNCYHSMDKNGIMAIIRNSFTSKNTETEFATIYKKNITLNCFDQIFNINGGIEINQLVLSSKF